MNGQAPSRARCALTVEPHGVWSCSTTSLSSIGGNFGRNAIRPLRSRMTLQPSSDSTMLCFQRHQALVVHPPGRLTTRSFATGYVHATAITAKIGATRTA
jgi:hypothetical protein